MGWPTVQLRHTLPDGTAHVDWMIARDPVGREPLITFRTSARIDLLAAGTALLLERIADHRAAFLSFEGPLTGGRGSVERVGRGRVTSWTRDPGGWRLAVAWQDGPPEEQHLRIERHGPTGWKVSAAPDGAANMEQCGASSEDPSEEKHMDRPSSRRTSNRPQIQHSEVGFGQTPPTPEEPAEVPVVEQSGPAQGSKKITAIERDRRHEETWSRVPNTTGTGAIHVRSFHCKLTDDALAYMDQTINEWLDAHPQYEVKFVNSTVGVLTGKLKEPHLVCQVWV